MSFLSKRRKPSSPCYPRMRFGISQQQLADLLGVSRSLVTMMEQGKRKLPRDVNAIYLMLCRKADELPSNDALTIKRGRKPTGSNANLFYVPLVSNFKKGNFDTRISWKRMRRLTALDSMPKPSLEVMAGEAKQNPRCNAFTDKLKEQKNRLINLYTFLEFKKDLRPLRHIELSARLDGINKMLDHMKPLEESLPDGRGKRRIQFLTALNSYKQLKLSKELKKWDFVELLKTELQMNCIRRQIGLTDEWIGALGNEHEQVLAIASSIVSADRENLFTEISKEDLGVSLVAA